MSERLTKRLLGSNAPYTEFADYNEIINRLCDLEDKIEQGKILELPCRVGQTVFRIITMGTGVKKKIVTHELNGFSVVKYKETQKRFIRDIEVTKNNFLDVCESYGKTVFLDRASAEAKLREMEGEKR